MTTQLRSFPFLRCRVGKSNLQEHLPKLCPAQRRYQDRLLLGHKHIRIRCIHIFPLIFPPVFSILPAAHLPLLWLRFYNYSSSNSTYFSFSAFCRAIGSAAGSASTTTVCCTGFFGLGSGSSPCDSLLRVSSLIRPFFTAR